MKADCWVKGGGKEGQGLKKKSGVNEDAAVASEKLQADNIKAWAVIEEVSEEAAEAMYGPASIAKETSPRIQVKAELYNSGALHHCPHFDTNS